MNLKEFRKSTGLSQPLFAKRIKYSASTIRQIEQGKILMSSRMETIIKNEFRGK